MVWKPQKNKYVLTFLNWFLLTAISVSILKDFHFKLVSSFFIDGFDVNQKIKNFFKWILSIWSACFHSLTIIS